MVFGVMLGAGVLLASALSPQSAHAADDTKRYAGNGCMTRFNSELIDRNGSAIFNPSTSAILVVCPVIRDNTGTSSLGVKKGFVLVVDGNAAANQDVICTLAARNASNVLVTFQTVRSLGSNATPQKLPFAALPVPVGGLVVLGCVLPPSVAAATSGVLVYEITEN
jgi:hypothetical protein